ncbi:chemokine XC receptor 1-like [Plectropomus leopardus]|uniref:chemokine XC receptor 1-like n=1 Tax=Plectropomus leopardus TaxID=160734 RepID=UPI001C4D004A|nr:chemokine XC receptor 1-like [Plectropomus leopardus]
MASTLSDGGVSISSDDKELLCEETFSFDTISGVIFIFIFVLSITGNCLLLCVLAIYENLKNVTNLFVLNLACSDLLFTVTLPFWAVLKLHHWIFGEFACKLLTALYIIGLYSSIVLLTAMTVDRFVTVVLHNWPSNRLRRQRCAIVACAVAWIIGIAASVSDAIKVKVVNYWDGLYNCEDTSEGYDVNLGYYLQVSLLFFLPFAIIVLCYSAILKTVLQASNRRRYKTVVVVLCIVAAFFICWGPFNILLFIEPFYEPKSCEAKKQLNIAFDICKILAFSHCCMNPLLYMLSQKLRRHLLDLLCCMKARVRYRASGITKSTSVIQNVAFVAQNSAIMLELN